jgi:hypothetical protein
VIADEIATEIRLLRAAEAERARHEQAREHAYLAVDPDQLARTLPGIGAVGGPMLVAVMGNPDRFANGAAFKACLGLTPKAAETGETDRKGQPMSKAGNRDLRSQLIRSAETARRHDPQLAAVCYDQMVNKGAVHNKALCVVAAKLAERAWSTLRRDSPYELRTVDGTPIDHATANSSSPSTTPSPKRRDPPPTAIQEEWEGPSQQSDAPEALDEATFPPDSSASRPTTPNVKTRTSLLTPEAT